MVILRELLANPEIDRLENRLLLSFITKLSHAQLISRDSSELSSEQYMLYISYVERLYAGEPLAYILGYKEFYGRCFKVTSDTLIPRPETELLVDEVLKRARKCASILDLGTGSGVIGISCKLERPDLRVVAIDKYPETLTVARENADNLLAKVEIKHGDWYSAFDGMDCQFDIIVSNPPYIEADDHHLDDLSYEPKTALTDFADGLSCIQKIIAGVGQYLLPNGWVIIEHGYNQGSQVREIFIAAKLQQVITLKDYAGLERITLGQAYI